MLEGFDDDLSFVWRFFARLRLSIVIVSNVLMYLLVYDSPLCLAVLSLQKLFRAIRDL